MPATQREEELLRLLRMYSSHLQQRQDIDPANVQPFGPEDAAVQRWLQLAVQCCLDLGDSILARLGLPEPSRSRDIFAVLARAGVIEQIVVAPLEQLATFRNMLAHAYADLSPTETWQQVRRGLPALTTFASSTNLFLQ